MLWKSSLYRFTNCIERSRHDRLTIVIQLLETTKGWSIPCLDRCRLADVLLLELISLGKERKNHLPSDIPICATARPLSLFPHVLAGECSKKHAKPMGSLCFQIHQITRFSSSSPSTSQSYSSASDTSVSFRTLLRPAFSLIAKIRCMHPILLVLRSILHLAVI